MPGSATESLRVCIVAGADVCLGSSLRTAMDSDARPISIKTGWFVMAPSSALHPAP